MLNKKLRAAREKKHWSMETAAEKIGVSKTSIARWENGEQKPRGASLDLVCTAYGMSVEELGLVEIEKETIAFSDKTNITNNQSLLQALTKDIQNSSFKRVERRTFLHTIISDACITLFLPTLELFSADSQDRIRFSIEYPSLLDSKVLDDLEIMTRSYWQLRANITSNVVLSGAIGHFQMLTKIMQMPCTTSTYKRLCSTIGEIGQIIGQMLFDMKEYTTAWSYYIFSVQAAQRAFNDRLRAVGLGRMGQLLLYANQFQESLVYLQEAQSLAITDIRIKCWLAVVAAEVYARMKQSTSCIQNLDIARNFEASLLGEDYYSIGFNEARLESYAGICYTYLEKPEQALTTLQKALSLQDTNAIRRRSTILTDKSAALVQLENIKAACADMEEALDLTRETQSMQALERIKLVHQQMSPWKTDSIVKELDNRIKSVFTLISI